MTRFEAFKKILADMEEKDGEPIMVQTHNNGWNNLTKVEALNSRECDFHGLTTIYKIKNNKSIILDEFLFPRE